MIMLLLLVLVVLPLAACGSTAHATPRSGILFIGDSLTRGAFATDQAHDYVSLVTHALRLPASVVQVVATYGTTTLASDLALRHVRLVPATRVVVELGTNDLGKPLEQFATDYRTLIARLRQSENGARFVCLGLWRDPAHDGALPAGSPFDAIIQQACPGAFVPLSGLYMTCPCHGPQGRSTWLGAGDWFHPNDQGHAAIASAILAALAH